MSRAAVHARVYCLATTAHELRKRLINQNKIEYHKTIPCGCSSRLRALPCHYSDVVPKNSIPCGCSSRLRALPCHHSNDVHNRAQGQTQNKKTDSTQVKFQNQYETQVQ